MAIVEKSQVDVIVNSSAAAADINRLTLLAEEYRFELEKANKAGDMKSASLFSKRLNQVNKELKTLKSETKSYQQVLENLEGSTLKELRAAYRSLNAEVSKLNPQSQAYIDKMKQLRTVKGQIDQHNASLRQQGSFLERTSAGFNKYFSSITATVASLTGLIYTFNRATSEAEKMDDTYSDVMKTTGMTREEVVALNEEFTKIDTRTSREELNQFARDAGKLGIAKEDVLEFVKASDQIRVALGEDLGEDAIINIGKIAEVMQLPGKMGVEKSYLSVGSAINALGQDSSASEAYLVDFTQRLAGAGYQARLSTQDILGYASSLDQSGMKVEMAATAFQTFIMKMFSETETFAKYAGMEVSEFSRLLDTDANAAIIKVLTSLNKAGGFKQLIPMFKEMGADGARAISVLSSMATNIDAVTEAQELANVEFEKATSLTAEFETKNNNLMAQRDKANKAFKDSMVELGEFLSPLFIEATKAGSSLIKVIISNGKEVAILTGGVIAAAAGYKLYSSRVAISNTLSATGTVITKALSAAYYLLTGRLSQASVAWKALNTAFKASVIGAIITAVTALAAGLVIFVRRTQEAQRAVSKFYAETEKLKMESDSLLSILEKNTSTTSEYKQALEKLTELYGPYIADLITEKGELTDIELARKRINTEIEREIANKIKQEAVDKVSERSLKNMAKDYEKIVQQIIRRKNVGEDAARIYARQATEMLKAGESVNDVWIKLFAGTKGVFNDTQVLKNFKDEYSNMIEDIADINSRFEFLDPGSVTSPRDTSFVGPIVLTSEQLEKKKKELEQQQQLLAAQSAEERERSFQDGLTQLDAQQAAELLRLKKSYLAKEISETEYTNRATVLELNYLATRNLYYIQYNKDNTDAEAAYVDKMISFTEHMISQRQAIIDENPLVILDESIVDSETDTLIEKFLSRYKKMQSDAEEIRKRYAEKSWDNRDKENIIQNQELLSREKARLGQLHEEGLISQKEYEDELGRVRIENLEDIMNFANNIINSTSNLISAIQEKEFAQLEVRRQQELAKDGTTADARAEIEAKYEAEKLEIQKKYADIEMGMKISQAIASGALASVQAWNAAGGNPILAAIFMGLIAATTAAQVASIVAQRNAIKSESVDTSSSSTVAVRNVNGYSEGGYTKRSSSDSMAVGVVHANEWVAPAAMVRANPTVFRLLENVRTNKVSRSGAVGFRDGGYTGSGNTSGVSSVNTEVLESLIVRLMKKLDEPLTAQVVYSELKKKEETYNSLKKAGSR